MRKLTVICGLLLFVVGCGDSADGGGDGNGGANQCVGFQELLTDFRGSDPVGTECDVSGTQTNCESGRCIKPEGESAVCSVVCTSDADCNGLSCNEFIGPEGEEVALCVQEGVQLCDQN